jgi:hypothetical protein
MEQGLLSAADDGAEGIGFNLKKRFQSLPDDLELGIIAFLL